MATTIRSAVGKLGSKYSSRCHSKGRIVANMVRVGDFQISSAIVNNYNIDHDVLFSTSKPPFSYGYSSRHPFLFGNYHKKPLPVLHLQCCPDFYRVSRQLCGGFSPCPCFIDDPDTISPTSFAVKEYNKQKNAQLQFVRVLRAWHERLGGYMLYYLTLEAVDEGVVKVYQALVNVFCYDTMELKLFGLLNVDNGSLLKLFFKRPTTPDGVLYDRTGQECKKKVPRKTSRNCIEEEILTTLVHM
ncbi:hypothetical protein ACE6H2_019029 [Prunus campanulata]